MSWFAKNGGRVLTSITAVAALAATQKDLWGTHTLLPLWLVFAGAAAATLHTIWFPGENNAFPSLTFKRFFTK